MALLIAIDSHRTWIAVPLDTRLMLLTFPGAPGSRPEGPWEGSKEDRASDSIQVH